MRHHHHQSTRRRTFLMAATDEPPRSLSSTMASLIMTANAGCAGALRGVVAFLTALGAAASTMVARVVGVVVVRGMCCEFSVVGDATDRGVCCVCCVLMRVRVTKVECDRIGRVVRPVIGLL